jgi:branched-chain amino acid transport system ATP-binding protein
VNTPVPTQDAASGDPILRLQELRVTLGGSSILHGVSFDVAPNGVTALLGRNGVGKTTTLRAIMGLAASRGSVRFAGTDISGMATHRIARRGIGYVPEDRAIFASLTVAENLRLAQPDPRSDRWSHMYELFPVLRERAAQPAGTLSGGEQQMLALGRVLLVDNRLLLVDEPTKGLAPRIATEVAVALARIAQAVPVLLVEQNLAVVRHAARNVVVLDTGRVVHTGDAAGLLGDPRLTNELLGVALKEPSR